MNQPDDIDDSEHVQAVGNEADEGTALASADASIDTQRLEAAYMSFVNAILTRVTREAEAHGIPFTSYVAVTFVGTGLFRQQSRLHPDYRQVLLAYDAFAQPRSQPRSAAPDTPLDALTLPPVPTEREREEDAIIASCARAHWEAGLFRSPEPGPVMYGATGPAQTFEQVQDTIVRELLVPLVQTLEHLEQLEQTTEKHGHIGTATGEAIRAAYRRAFASWSSPTVQWEVITPLLHFHSEHEGDIGLTAHLRLTPLTPERKSTLWNTQARGSASSTFAAYSAPLPLITFSSASSCLIGVDTYTRGHEPTPSATIPEVADVVTALRLLKQGDVAAPATFQQAESSFLALSAIMSLSLGPGRLPRGVGLTQPYILEKAEVPALQRLIQEIHRLNALPHLGGLAVALRRFNQAYTRDWLVGFEDRIIDLTIALESTVLADVQDELQYRLALRGAAILASVRPPHETRLLLETAYKVRSKIVHEGKTLSELTTLTQRVITAANGFDSFVSVCEDVVRDILRFYVHHVATGTSLKKVNADLDTHITGTLASPETPGTHQ